MTRIEYDLMVADHPELGFPEWIVLSKNQKDLVEVLKRDFAVKRRQIFLISKSDQEVDWTEGWR